jgi:fumarylacetoacetase
VTWIDVPDGTRFGIDNLPYGVFSRAGHNPRVGVAIGDLILDLAPVLDDAAFAQPALNPFMARGRRAWTETRSRVVELLTSSDHRPRVQPYLVDAAAVTMHAPFVVADYVDFYSSLEHARNLGRILRPDSEPLLSNWRHLPVAYHGRAGTIVPSGTPITRPCGQRFVDGQVTYGPSRRLDVEAEVGFVVGTPSRLGEPVATSAFVDHVFGVVLVNDWSARDLQAWEYQPLGPFLGKSFATSISTWVVPLDALDAARVDGPPQDPEPLPYLERAARWGLDLALEIELDGTIISRPPFRNLYWTPDQQLAHMTANGACLRTGDLFASGTVSGEHPEERGSLIELTWNGRDPLRLPGGEERLFLEDGDTVTLRATAPSSTGGQLALGDVAGTVAPARCRSDR